MDMDRTMRLKEYQIPFSGLKQGKHQFEFQIDKTFFEAFSYDEFRAANVTVKAVLDKMSTMMELELQGSGTVNLACDITDEPFDQPIDGRLELVIKFGEEYSDEDDEILVLPHGEHQFNVAQYIYEMIVLSVPSKRIHPGVADGSLQSEALKRLEELQPKKDKDPADDTDPRWDALRDLLTD
jgi:uncharacterized metal-binding protein YceD (DUF177 family)